jgi:FkbM family methyltransferase
MKYKFIDIGCSFFMVSSDKFGTNVDGIFVEPIKEFLDILPKSNTIIKENFAIGDYCKEVEFNFYVPKNIKLRYYNTKELSRMMEKYKKEDDFHFIHEHSIIGAITGSGGSSLFERTDESIIKNKFIDKKIIKVKMITLYELFKRNDVREIDYIKIDVEGNEEIILLQLLKMMRENFVRINKAIEFECNMLSNKFNLNTIANAICLEFGFKYTTPKNIGWDENILLEKL